MKQDNKYTIWRSFIFILILVLATGLIVFLKGNDNTPLPPQSGNLQQENTPSFVQPDTTNDFETDTKINTIPIETDSKIDSDTITLDLREPADAGFEDGYYAGLQDGIEGEDHASYDESSQFPKPVQRQAYTNAYRQGYKVGYEDGINGGEKHPSPVWDAPNSTSENTNKEKKLVPKQQE